MIPATPAVTQAALASQAAFRCIMEAFARPGSVVEVPETSRRHDGLPPAAAAVLLTLCDFETPLYMSPSCAAIGGLTDWLSFFSDAPITKRPEAAAFALIDLRFDIIDLAVFAQGTPDYPDRSTTLICLCDALEGGSPLTLSGPGIKATQRFHPAPWPAALSEQWLGNRKRFPQGVDLLFCAGNAIAALPRTTRILEDVR
jgi:alpha-D-ribose 1-methylphosphonate 5-triphosphate synthase subunit PhnH